MARKAARPGTSKAVSPNDIIGARFPDLSLELTRDRIAVLDETAASLGILLTRTALAHVQESEAKVHRSAGWSWAGFRILYIIWMFDEVEARDLARISGVSRQATSTVLATLESAGLVERERTSTVDKRLVTVRLTHDGSTAFEQAFAEQNILDVEIFASLTDDEKSTLRSLLQRVLGGMLPGPADADD